MNSPPCFFFFLKKKTSHCGGEGINSRVSLPHLLFNPRLTLLVAALGYRFGFGFGLSSFLEVELLN